MLSEELKVPAPIPAPSSPIGVPSVLLSEDIQEADLGYLAFYHHLTDLAPEALSPWLLALLTYFSKKLSPRHTLLTAHTTAIAATSSLLAQCYQIQCQVIKRLNPTIYQPFLEAAWRMLLEKGYSLHESWLSQVSDSEQKDTRQEAIQKNPNQYQYAEGIISSAAKATQAAYDALSGTQRS